MKSLLVSVGKFIQNAIRIFGIDIFLKKPGYHYVPDFYGRTAFKHVDIRTLPVFGDLAKKIIAEKKTSHYYDRLYTIYQAISNISQLPYEQNVNFAEVGVYKGGTSKFIASVARSMSLPYKLYGFDTFEGHAGVDIVDIDGNHTAQLFGDTSLETVSDYLKHHSEISLYKGRFQDTSNEFDDAIFHFVHLDVDLYEPTLYALMYFADHISQSGIIIVDDYRFSSCLGVEKALGEFLVKRNDFTYFHTLSGQMILIKQ